MSDKFVYYMVSVAAIDTRSQTGNEPGSGDTTTSIQQTQTQAPHLTLSGSQSNISTSAAERALSKALLTKKNTTVPKTPSLPKRPTTLVQPVVDNSYVSLLTSMPSQVNTQAESPSLPGESPAELEDEIDVDLNNPRAVW